MRAIETPRLVLRELAVADVTPKYVEWLNDERVTRYLETRFHEQDEASVRNFVETIGARDNEFLFGIFVRQNMLHIGNIKVGPINPYHGVADISLFIGDVGSWGKGYASEAIAAVSGYAFAVLNLRKLAAGVYDPNKGSYHAFLKVGYRQEGRRREHYTLYGAPCDLIELGLLPGELVR